MKNFLLYFFALALCFTLLPLVPEWLPLPEDKQPPLIHLLDSKSGEVRELPLEDYVIGVLSAADYPYEGEALKAIAIAIRSCAVYCEEHTPVHANAAVCDNPSCCPACRMDAFSPSAVEAAAETVGLLITYQGRAAAALTHESSGTYTASSKSCYGIALPYLTEQKNVDEQCTTERAWRVEEFRSLLGVAATAKPAELRLAYDVSLRVREARWEGTIYSGEQLARLLSLPSCCFTLTEEDGMVLAVCQGAGNGVGMSRNGAWLLAKQGKTFREILTFYYPQTEIRPLS